MKRFRKFFRTVATLLMVIIIIAVGHSMVIRYLHPKNFSDHIEKYSSEYNVPKELVFAVVKCESSFDPNAKSNKDAVGLMQLTEETFNDVKKINFEKALSAGKIEYIHEDVYTSFIEEVKKQSVIGDETINKDGPAPDSTQPSTPSSCLNASIISFIPGTSFSLYGWCNLSFIATFINLSSLVLIA